MSSEDGPALGRMRRGGVDRYAIAETLCPACFGTGYLATHGQALCGGCLAEGRAVPVLVIDLWADQ